MKIVVIHGTQKVSNYNLKFGFLEVWVRRPGSLHQLANQSSRGPPLVWTQGASASADQDTVNYNKRVQCLRVYTQIAKSVETISIRYWFDTNVSERYLCHLGIDENQIKKQADDFFCLWRVNNHICIDSICKYMATRYTLNHKFPILKHLVMNNISKMFLVASLLIVIIIVKPSLNKMGAWAGLQSPGANQTCFLKSHLKLTSKLQMAAHEHCFLTCEEVYLDESIRAYIDICFEMKSLKRSNKRISRDPSE